MSVVAFGGVVVGVSCLLFFFFFQAEDGIRDVAVTGVQTCALPIAIAGCMVIEGVVHRNRPIRVLREDIVIFEGELESLRRFKDDASEVRAGMECGIGVKSYTDVKVGDKIEVYEKVQVARSL